MRKNTPVLLISLGFLAFAVPRGQAALAPMESDEFNGQEAPDFYILRFLKAALRWGIYTDLIDWEH